MKTNMALIAAAFAAMAANAELPQAGIGIHFILPGIQVFPEKPLPEIGQAGHGQGQHLRRRLHAGGQGDDLNPAPAQGQEHAVHRFPKDPVT